MIDILYNDSVDLNNANDMHIVFLYNKPSQWATWYTRMKAFGNRFCVEDPQSMMLQAYDIGVAFILYAF